MKKSFKAAMVSIGIATGMGGFITNAHALSWVLSPDANALAFGVTAVAGLTEINAPDGATQAQGIFGAGFAVNSNNFSMNFDADLYSWDSYNALNGTGTGYWDAFIVTVSTQDFYWNLPSSDPVIADSSTFVWGGKNYNDGILESYVTAPGTTDSINLNAGNAMYYVSIVLDTKTLAESDKNHPSWGSFHVDPVVSPVPEPETYAMLLAGLGLIGFSARNRSKIHSFTIDSAA